ncbi:MAG: aldo/keto reductase [Enterococcus gallinarum]|nr:aldo/keto reductase [Enterococcus gallinarum]
MHSLTDTITLNEQVSIPGFGLGVFQIPDEEVATVVKNGILKGYRLIDAAQIYDNESGTGQGIKEGLAATGLTREELFVTSKVWNNYLTYDETIVAFEKSLALLQLDYLDLYLLHWPGKNAYQESWRALEDLHQAGKIKAIGVSNFLPHHFEELKKTATIFPMVNQIFLAPGELQKEVVSYCQEHNVLLEAYSPLGTGKIFDVPEMQELSDKYGKTIAQIAIRWSLQHDFLPLPKSVTPSRIEENLAVFDFELSDEDMQRIDQLDGVVGKATNPDTTGF